jgi:hypothetical protein
VCVCVVDWVVGEDRSGCEAAGWGCRRPRDVADDDRQPSRLREGMFLKHLNCITNLIF